MISPLATALSDAMGPQVVVCSGVARDLPLWRCEAAAVAKAIPKRQAEFATGRDLARQGMRALGVAEQAIVMGPDRAPIWPDGLIGSISHTHGQVIAAVAKASKIKAIGVDIEQDRALDPAVAARIVMEDDSSDPALATVVFSAKEAVYKAMYPHCRTLWDFGAVTLRINDDETGFEARLNVPAGEFGTGTRFDGILVRRDGLIGTALVCAA